MKPLTLQGHSRPIKSVKFTKDGENLITCSSDRTIIIWSVATGKKSAILSHSAAVNVFNLSKNEDLLFSCDNTGTLYIWDIDKTKILRKIEYEVSVNIKNIEVNDNNEEILVCMSNRSKADYSIIDIINIKKVVNSPNDFTFSNFKPTLRIESRDSKYTKAKIINNFTENENLEGILCVRENGTVEIIDYEIGKLVKSQKIHEDSINDFDYDNKSSLLLTVSKDGKAIVTHLKSFTIMTVYITENPKRPLNVCKLSPYVSKMCLYEEELEKLMKFHCIFAGGQESKLVTTTHSKEGGFEIIFLNLLEDKNVGRVQGHFGPVNALNISPNGKIVVSGGEDSVVRLYYVEDDQIFADS